jgi:uncharacterized protein YjbI with pentapeptide repeats
MGNKFLTTIIVSIALIILAIYGANSSMANKPLESKWNDLFQAKPEVITEFSRIHGIHLKNTEINHHDLSESHFINDSFENVNFNDSIFQDGSLTNVTFRGGTIFDTSFGKSVLTNVTFENMIMEKAIFVSAKLINVTFKNCRIYNSHMHNLNASKVTIEDSELNKVEFFDSELDITLKNTKVIELGMFGGLKPGSRVTLEDSYIGPYSDFSSSNIVSFKAIRSTLDSFPLGGNIDEVILDKSTLDFTLGSANIDRLNVTDCNIVLLSHGEASIRSVNINGCPTVAERLSFMDSVIEEINLRDCDIASFSLWDAKANKLNISNSKLGLVQNEGLMVNELTLHNVEFTGETIFKGAQAKDTELFKVTFEPTATLDATGSNIPFNQ